MQRATTGARRGARRSLFARGGRRLRRALLLRGPTREQVLDLACDHGGGRYTCRDCLSGLAEDPRIVVEEVQGIRELVTARDRYRIEELLGRGGMGAVYRARRESDGELVAVKMMIPRVAASPQHRDGFLRELELNARLAHDNVVRVLDHGSSGVGFYFVMEHCAGGSVADLARRRGNLAPREVVPLIVQACRGLAAAHERGLVHRDIKPANLLLTDPDGGTLKVADFGLAKEFEKAGLSGLTHTGSAGGTPHFMPREQLINFKYVKPVSDVWSLAACCYQLLTGRFVFDFQESRDPLAVVLEGQEPDVARSAPALPPALARALQRALAADPVRRTPSASAFAADLAGALTPDEPSDADRPVSVSPTVEEPSPTALDTVPATGSAGTSWRTGDVVTGTFEILGLLGSGGMGQVYRARHLEWSLDVAIKVAQPEILGSAAGRARFEAEAETWVNLGIHPYVVTCHYVRIIEDARCIVVEYVPGGTLAQRIASGRIRQDGVAAVLDAAIQVAWGLEHAHAHGVLHLDVKPDNILVASSQRLKVTDFGLAQALREPGSAGARALGRTAAYCSPEQLDGSPVDIASDIWSWAVCVLEMFIGEATWLVGPAAAAALDDIESGAARSGVSIPPSILNLLRRSLQARPADRPARMADVIPALVSEYEAATGTVYPRRQPRPGDLQADSLNNRGLSLLDLGRADQAGKLLEEALVIDPLNLHATYNRALLEWRSGRITHDQVVSRMRPVVRSDAESDAMLAAIRTERGEVEGEGVRTLWTSLTAHPGGVRSLLITHDGKKIVTGGTDRCLRTWGVDSGECLSATTSAAGESDPLRVVRTFLAQVRRAGVRFFGRLTIIVAIFLAVVLGWLESVGFALFMYVLTAFPAWLLQQSLRPAQFAQWRRRQRDGRGHADSVIALCEAPDGRIVSGGADGLVCV